MYIHVNGNQLMMLLCLTSLMVSYLMIFNTSLHLNVRGVEKMYVKLGDNMEMLDCCKKEFMFKRKEFMYKVPLCLLLCEGLD